jgi:hypothetical protein
VTETVCRSIGIFLFVLFSAYGLVGTLRIVQNATTPPGPRPWALFAVFELVEGAQVFGLVANLTPRPAADIKAAAVVAIAALCFCAFTQRLYFQSAKMGQIGRFSRIPFYIGVAVLLGVVFGAHLAGPNLP